ncbi:leukocyte elastase inhibitor-like [Topomyia yanbarensis]|uniref:leukocyte elastase inhibitor-like n=1 Tax=Topomyia yanbarensis TaxID=2498891 RepID=UPI00273BD92B|nr:leukocyte elastase inhibitor-like [Topomyia yanbarensis]
MNIDYLQDIEFLPKPPLIVISVNAFTIDCSTQDVESEIYFHLIESHGKRRMVTLPAITIKKHFKSGYLTEMDVTVAVIEAESQDISTILIMPGQQGGILQKDSLTNMEAKFLQGDFSRNIDLLLHNIKPVFRSLQLPRIHIKSVMNNSEQLFELGLSDLLFSNTTNLKGLQGITTTNIHLSEMLQVNHIILCKMINQKPQSTVFEQTDYNGLYFPTETIQGTANHRQTSPDNENTTIRFNKPFMFVIRHNLTRMILYIGRFNPI